MKVFVVTTKDDKSEPGIVRESFENRLTDQTVYGCHDNPSRVYFACTQA